MYILGISAFFHDSAACLIYNGEIVACAQEERFTRVKHDNNFPTKSIKFCLKKAGIDFNSIHKIVFYEKPFLKFERLIETYLSFAPFGYKSFATSMPIWIKEKLFQKILIKEFLTDNFQINDNLDNKILFSEHHLSHAASSFFPSPFKSSAILTVDGVGEWATTTYSLGHENKIKIIKEINFPHSLGLLYSSFTYFLGFKVNSGEYKVMGLAPYGSPHYVNKIYENLIDVKEDGSFKLNMSYFNYCTGMTMTNNKFSQLFGIGVRKPESALMQIHMDIAASIQKITEDIIIKMAKHIKNDCGEKNLCLSGGVALNCVANGKILKENIFQGLWIQPAAGDSGGAIGAALAVWYMKFKNDRIINKDDSMKGSFLGPQFQETEIEDQLKSCNAVFKKYNELDLLNLTSNLIAKKKIIGWMQGSMEFGPRALGARSILADPRDKEMQKNLNLKIKFRESFRPFAPCILEEFSKDWFDLDLISPYMLFVGNINEDKRLKMTEEQKKLFGINKLNIPKSITPAITHVDYSSRVQTVNEKTNPKFYNLLREFYKLTGCPILINTSFNIRGEPIVCSPFDAFKCFMGTEIDVLVIENFVLLKHDQNKKLLNDYKSTYDLD